LLKRWRSCFSDAPAGEAIAAVIAIAAAIAAMSVLRLPKTLSSVHPRIFLICSLFRQI
jgi:hypothetical protein